MLNLFLIFKTEIWVRSVLVIPSLLKMILFNLIILFSCRGSLRFRNRSVQTAFQNKRALVRLQLYKVEYLIYNYYYDRKLFIITIHPNCFFTYRLDLARKSVKCLLPLTDEALRLAKLYF